jgi:nucleoside-triphosphatase THEP1
VSTPPPPAPADGPGLLIAVTGEPGTGKTRRLAALAAWHRATGGVTAGFVAAAQGRPKPGRGADAYRLHNVDTQEGLAWLERDESRSPPYRFASGALASVRAWIAAWPRQPALVVLDEWGKFEAAGGGLLALWPDIARTRPRLLVVAVRAGLEEAIEARLGRRFDRRVRADDPAAESLLQEAAEAVTEWTRIGLFGGVSGAIEMSAGSALHAAKVPLRGLLLSSLQGAMMVFAGFGLREPGRVVWVPFIATGLKALSPAGNRLRPMLAIFMQGLLFGTVVQVLGWRWIAVVLGGGLIGVWSVTQGFVLQYLLLGDNLFRAYDTAVEWVAGWSGLTAPSLPLVIAGWATLQAFFAATVAGLAWRLQQPPAALRRLLDRDPAPARPPARRGRWREFTRWPFWLPLVVVALILLAGGSGWATVGWLTLRFLAVAVVLSALVLWLKPATWAGHLRRRGWWGPAMALADAIERRSGPPPPPDQPRP